MTKGSAILLLGHAFALATGCGSSIDKAPNGGANVNQLLTPNANGWIDRSTSGTTGIQGQWHARADGRFPVPGDRVPDCQTTKFGECSIVDEPAPGSTYAPTAGLGMCTSGVIARWIARSDGMTPDDSPGSAGIVLDLNLPDWPDRNTFPTAPTGLPYDADAHTVTGFAFDTDAEPAPGAGMVVQVASTGPARPFPDSKPAYWKAATPDQSPVHAGHNEFLWGDLGPGPFYRNQILRIAFLVSGNDAQAVSYSFCIDNLTALRSANLRPALEDQLLVPDANGWVARSTTGTTYIQGVWFAAADGGGALGVPPGKCQTNGGHATSECSVFSEPDPATPYPPSKDLGMCTSGIVAKVVAGSDGGLNGDNIWGAMIGFNLNQTGLPEGRSDPFDAIRYVVTGFAFDIDSEPAPGAEIRVELSTLGTESNPAWWGGEAASWSPVHAGHNEFKWNDVGGPNYDPQPPAFDARNLIQIGFHVSANSTHAVSYSFCINNLKALRN